MMLAGKQRSGITGVLVVLLAALGVQAACASPYSSEPVDPSALPGSDASTTSEGGVSGDAAAQGDGGPPLPECAAQRVVHISAGNGSLAWFTLLWPLRDVIATPTSGDAYDDTTKAASVGTNAHPLYARTIGTKALWEGIGTHPMPSAFVVGTNQTHTTAPQTTSLSSGLDVVAFGASAQKGLAPLLPVLSVGLTAPAPYVSGPGLPTVTPAATVDAAIVALEKEGLTPAQEQQLSPSSMKLATWGVDATATTPIAELAKRLLFTANLFRVGVVGTVFVPGMNDDPHGAFQGVPFAATVGADALSRVLEGFYAELAASNELACGHRGKPLSLADNVVMIVSGDTPKNSYNFGGWPDGTIGNANFVYVRSNGWLQPGWFGDLPRNGTRQNFSPVTGLSSATATPVQSTDGALYGLLYAITRGDPAFMSPSGTSSFAGLLSLGTP